MSATMTAPDQDLSPTVAEIEDLLRSYPDCQPSDLDNIVWFLRHGPTLDNTLLASDPDLKSRIEAVRRDHPKRFAMSGRAFAVLLSVVAAMLIFAFAVWNHLID